MRTKIAMTLIINACIAMTAIASDIYRWTDPETGKVVTTPSVPPYPIKEKRTAGGLPNGELVNVILDAGSPEVKAAIEKRKAKEAEEKRISEEKQAREAEQRQIAEEKAREQAREKEIREAELKRVTVEKTEEQASKKQMQLEPPDKVSFSGIAQTDYIKASAIMDNIRIIGQDCEWALKVDNAKMYKCVEFMGKLQPGGEFAQVSDYISELNKDRGIAEQSIGELRTINRHMQEIVRYKEFMLANLGVKSR